MPGTKKRKGRTKFNKQWIKQHRRHLAKLNLGQLDKLTGKKKT